MSIEGTKQPDIYDQLLQPERRASNQRISNGQYQSYHPHRQSDPNPPKIHHTCVCYAQCDGMRCPCYQTTDQICIKGYCCINCIKLKNSMLQNNRQNEGCNCKNTQCLKQYCKCFRMNGYCSGECKCQGCLNSEQSVERWQAIQILEGQHNSLSECCTCKKTKCGKKYCSCFSAGRKCTVLCSCQNCINCNQERHKSNQMEQQPIYYQEEVLDEVEIPTDMDFQPVSFIYQP